MRFFNKPAEPAFLKDLSDVFSRRIRKYGDSPKGVLWKNSEGQLLRFEVLAGILDDAPPSTNLSINDFGCGYGALFDYLEQFPNMSGLTYTGYDISPDMINVARRRIGDRRVTFSKSSKIKSIADFTLVSGTFNLKLTTADKTWEDYVKSSLGDLWSMSTKGLAFNMLDCKHPDRGDGLYYADAIEYLDFCSRFSDNVTLVDNYPLAEWTIFVRR